jgi:hypothetical protein
LLRFAQKRLELMVQRVDLLFMHFVHYTHVLTQSIVLFLENAVLLLKLDITIEQPPCILSISALAQARLPFRYHSLYNPRFLGQSEPIGSDYFPRPLRGCLAGVPAEIGVSTGVVDAFGSLI